MTIMIYTLDATSSEEGGDFKVTITLDTAMAARIHDVSVVVKEHGLLKASIWALASWRNGDEELRTDVDQVVIYEDKFHLSTAIKHTNTALTSSPLKLSELFTDFDLEPVPLPSPTATQFVIRSASEALKDEAAYAYWNNQFGWGNRSSADVFSRAETQTISLPIALHSDAQYEAWDIATAEQPGPSDQVDELADDAGMVPVDFSNLGEMVMDYVEAELSNNEASSDEEMAADFKDSGLSDEQVKSALAHRSFYLSNIVHSQNSPLRRTDDVLVFKASAGDFVPATL